jgi:hypothetical protein
MTVVRLVTLPEMVRESAIEKLENALELARAGQLQSVAIAGVLSNGDAQMWLSESDRSVTLLGATHALAHMIVEELL